MDMRHKKIRLDGRDIYYVSADMSLRASLPKECCPADKVRSHLPQHPEISRKSLAISVTNRCNMACKYCYAADYVCDDAPEMEYAAFTKIIDKMCADVGTYSIRFIGGEPFLNRELIYRGIEYCEKRSREKGGKYNYTVSTNGTLIDTYDASALKKYMVKVKVEFDGDKACHNRFRPMKNGDCSYSRVARSLSILQDVGCDYDIVSVLPPSCVSSLSNAFSEISKYSPHRVRFSTLLQRDSAGLDDAEYDAAEYSDSLYSLARQLVDSERYDDLMRISNISSYFKMIHTRTPRLSECPAIRGDNLAIDVDGSIYPCSTLVGKSNYCMGSYTSQSKSAAQCGKCDSCKSCWAYELCGGGCLTEITEGVSSVKCAMRKAEIEIALKIYGELYGDSIIK